MKFNLLACASPKGQRLGFCVSHMSSPPLCLLLCCQTTDHIPLNIACAEDESHTFFHFVCPVGRLHPWVGPQDGCSLRYVTSPLIFTTSFTITWKNTNIPARDPSFTHCLTLSIQWSVTLLLTLPSFKLKTHFNHVLTALNRNRRLHHWWRCGRHKKHPRSPVRHRLWNSVVRPGHYLLG